MKSNTGRMERLYQPTSRSPHGGKSTGSWPRDASPSAIPYQSPSQTVTELAAKAPFLDLAPRVKNLGVPASCNFVLNLLDRYLRAHVFGETTTKKSSLPTMDTLLALVKVFILHKPVKQGTKEQKVLLGPPPTATEEMQLLLALHKQLEEQQNLELRFATFDAIFGGNSDVQKVSDKVAWDISPAKVLEMKKSASGYGNDDILNKLVSLAISLESSGVLSCIALWMQSHSIQALALSKSLYHDFCVLLPDAMEPILQLASVSPHLAHQMAIAFTTLYPLHSVGAAAPEVEPANLYPPIRLLEVITHWIETSPEFLFPTKLLDVDLGTLSMQPQTQTPRSGATTLLGGLMQWCVLTPLLPKTELCRHLPEKGQAKSRLGDSNPADVRSAKVLQKKTRGDFGSLVAKLHADLLSVILSHSKSFRYLALTSDCIAVLVATLLGFSQQLRKTEGGVASKMGECVERLAQFLQIGLSTGIILLNPDDLSSMASTLPENRLLNLVIEHHQ